MGRRSLLVLVMLLLVSCGPLSDSTERPRPTKSRAPTPAPQMSPVPRPTPAPTPTEGLPPPTLVPATAGVLVVQPRYADGQPMRDMWLTVYQEAQDANGAPIYGEEIEAEYLDESGSVSFVLPPGRYAIELRVRGYAWPAFFGHEIRGGETATVVLALGRLTFVLRRADGTLVTDQWVDVSLQGQNANGQPIYGEEAASEWIDDTGQVSFDLTPGVYALETKMDGSPWSACLFGHPVESGQVTELSCTLGRVQIELRHPGGSVATDRWVDAYTQALDANGNPIRGEDVRSIWVGATGIAAFDLTPGTYVFVSGKQELYGVAIDSGQTVVREMTIPQ